MNHNAIIEKTVMGMGFELIDIEYTPAKTIRVFADQENGITVDDCALISNQLTRVLLVENIEYNRLEVSSPGLERPLKKLSDYIKFTGKLIKIKLHQPVEQIKVHIGIIESVNNNDITLADRNNLKKIVIDLDNISRARLIFENNKVNKR